MSLLELLIVLAITTAVSGAVLRMGVDSQHLFRAQIEVADVHQRLRVAADRLYRDLLMAGAGGGRGARSLPLGTVLPAIRPARRGEVAADGELTFASDRVSILHAAPVVAAPLLRDMSGPTDLIWLDTGQPWCPADGVCGFAPGAQALIFDGEAPGAGYDIFRAVAAVPGALAHAPLSRAYSRPHTWLSGVEQHVYYLDTARHQLRHYDGRSTDVPVADHIVGLEFGYFVDPDPSTVQQPEPGRVSCVFDGGIPARSLLQPFSGDAPVRLGARQLTDGPVCGVAPNRFDGDLLRVRTIRVSIRVQVADEALRGQDPIRYVNPGPSANARRAVPDYAITFDVSPRTLNPDR